jgi:imidazole glycerol-phosphate synthase subunit HisH
MSSKGITIIDYGVGNLLSVRRAFEHCGARVTITSDPKLIERADRLVLPGVGAFPNAMELINRYELAQVVKDFATSGKPLLAICLGMQLLMDESEEFTKTAGLSLIPGRVVELPKTNSKAELIKIPHIGWSPIFPRDSIQDWQGTILSDNSPGNHVYFVHSFMASLVDHSNELAYTSYEGLRVPAVVNRDNIIGCQFHPEKSGEVGLRMLNRFYHD